MKYQGDRMESSIGQEMGDDVVNRFHTDLAPEWGVNSRASLFMWILLCMSIVMIMVWGGVT